MVYFHDVVGNVTELLPPGKCSVTFVHKGKMYRALLVTKNLIVDGSRVPANHMVQDYLHVGSTLRFHCHDFDTVKDGMYDWFITSAWRQDKEDHVTHIKEGFLGLYQCSGKVSNLAKRQGVLTYVDYEGREHNILFLGSKLYLYGRHLNSKQTLQEGLNDDDALIFDAVPCLPNENDFQCSWFASVVWKGRKPVMDYDNHFLLPNPNIATQYKQVANNPKSFFFRGQGVMMNVIDDEFGLALLAIKNNRWESVLFHRSTVMLFRGSVPADVPLGKVFHKGDRLSIIAAAAPKVFMAQWVATRVAVDCGPEINVDLLNV